MIILQNFTPEALEIARNNNIRLITLRNLKIDYKTIKKMAIKQIKD